MKIVANFHGILADWVGSPTAEFDLPAGATYANLLMEIGRRYTKRMPDQLWDTEANRFKKGVRAFGGTKPIDKLDRPLTDGQKITFYLMMAGG